MSCEGTNYNTSTSTSYKQITSWQTYRSYGSCSFLGYNSTDDVYLTPSKSLGLKNFLWFLATDQRGVGPASDGILGMCRQYQSGNYQSGPLMIQELYKTVKILIRNRLSRE
jgi:hypothetical protein